MFKHLDCLQAWGYIPRNFISTNMQPVCEDTVEGPFDRAPHTANNNNDHRVAAENLTEAVQAEESHIAHKAKADTSAPKHRDGMVRQELSRAADSVEPTSDIPKHREGMVRQELSKTADSVDDITVKGEDVEIVEVRGELSTRARNCNSKDETSDAPIQEHASLDETNLKT